MALTDLKIQAIKPSNRPQKVSDGDGLYLYVSTTGVKTWRMDYSQSGKRYTLTIGQYPLVKLAAARIMRSEIKQKLLDGINPAAEKQARKAVAKAQAEDTFHSIGEDWYNSKSAHRSDAWREANKLYLNRDLYVHRLSYS